MTTLAALLAAALAQAATAPAAPAAGSSPKGSTQAAAKGAAPAAPPARPGAARAAACRPAATVLDVKRPPGAEWFGLYLMGRKAGWLRSELSTGTRDGRPVLVARQETVIEAKVGPRTVRRTQTDERVYEAKPRGALLSFRSARKGDGGDRSVEVTCGPEACRAVLDAEDGRQARDLPRVAETAEQADAARVAAARCGEVAGVQLDPEGLRARRMRDRFVERAVLGGAGVTVRVSVVEESEEGDRIAARVYVADDGRMVEFRFGDALVAKAEPEEIARRVDLVDLFNLSRVALPNALPRSVPMEVAYTLKGLPPAFRVSDARQRTTPSGDATVITVTARRPAADDPARDVPRRRPDAAGGEDLAATPEVDWEHPDVRGLAERIVGATPGTWAASRKLVKGVHDRLEKVYGQSRDRASEVLRAAKGDCTEHALLFLALARATGIPARGVHGLVYANYGDAGPGLYWHAWAEVRVGDEWIPVDPTFDQDVADATHIALGRGTRVDAVGLLGALSVVKAEPRVPRPDAALRGD
jgi:transglutaminase-like putative cysteine protease